MPVHFDPELATLTDTVTVEDAETLANWLKAQIAQGDTPRVDLRACTHVHAAVLQTLLALKPVLAGAPAHPRLQAVLSGVLAAPTEAAVSEPEPAPAADAPSVDLTKDPV